MTGCSTRLPYLLSGLASTTYCFEGVISAHSATEERKKEGLKVRETGACVQPVLSMTRLYSHGHAQLQESWANEALFCISKYSAKAWSSFAMKEKITCNENGGIAV